MQKNLDIFNDFMKGITLFDDEKGFRPNIYEPIFNRHKENNEKCYIEKLVYNEICRDQKIDLNDLGRYNIEIKIEYSTKKYIEHIPKILHIFKNNEEYTYYKEFLYDRRIYMYPVYCTKKINNIIYKKENYGLTDNLWKLTSV